MDSEDRERFKDDLRHAFSFAKDGLPQFRRTITDKNVVIFLGNTRSGKSTLINYVIPTKLVAFKIRKNLFKIEKMDESHYGPHIGQGSLSDTTVPGVYRMGNQPNAVAVDAPGFSDNRGEIQDIMNAVYVNQIKFAQTCKFVLVSDINDLISDNIGGFLSLIAKMNELMPNFGDLRRSVSLVVTKDNNEYTQDEVAALLKDKILAVCGLNINKRNEELINCFAEQDELIGVFKMPSEAGEVANLDVNLEGSISSTHTLPMNRVPVKFAISSESQVVLLELCHEFADDLQFDAELKQLFEPYRDYFDIDDYVYASTDEELQQTRSSLRQVRQRLFIAENRFLQHVESILSSVLELVHLNLAGNFYKMMTLFVMLDETGLIEQSFKAVLVRKYRSTLRDLMAEVQELVKKIEREEKTRKDLDLDFSTKMAATGASAGAAAVGGALLSGLTMKTVATRVVGAFTGIGTILTVVGAAASIGSYLIKKEEVERRTTARMRQGRPVPDF